MFEFKRISTLQDILFVYELQLCTDLFEEKIENKDFFIESFQRKLKGFYHDFFIVLKSDIRAGAVLAYDYRFYDRHCKISIALENGNKEDIVKIILKFMDYLYSSYPLNKVFTYQENAKLIEAFIECGFIQEALLEGYRFIEGQRKDIYILSVKLN